MADISGNQTGCNSAIEIEASCTTTSAEEPLSTLSFQLAPNPTNGRVLIEFPTADKVNARLYNSLGILVEETRFEQSTWLDYTALPTGRYWIQLETETGVATQALQIE